MAWNGYQKPRDKLDPFLHLSSRGSVMSFGLLLDVASTLDPLAQCTAQLTVYEVKMGQNQFVTISYLQKMKALWQMFYQNIFLCHIHVLKTNAMEILITQMVCKLWRNDLTVHF